MIFFLGILAGVILLLVLQTHAGRLWFDIQLYGIQIGYRLKYRCWRGPIDESPRYKSERARLRREYQL